MCQVTRNGAGELPSPTPAGTNGVLPGSLGRGSQSAAVFLVQVLAFLGDGAPSLPRERHQMQGMPYRDAPEAFWKDLGLPQGESMAPVGVVFSGGRRDAARACSFPGSSHPRRLPFLPLHNTPAASAAIP